MKIISRFKAIFFFLIAAYLLAACGGTLPASTTSEKTPKAGANVSAAGAVVAFKVESSGKDDVAPSLEANSTPDLSDDVGSTLEVRSTSDPSSKDATGNAQNEIFGSVEAMTADTITVNGVTYNLANFTEIKNAVAVGDQVKLHVILSADGPFIVREIEKLTATTLEDNSNNSNGTVDDPNHDANDKNSSSAGQGADVGPNHDGNDDHGGSGGNSGPGGD